MQTNDRLPHVGNAFTREGSTSARAGNDTIPFSTAESPDTIPFSMAEPPDTKPPVVFRPDYPMPLALRNPGDIMIWEEGDVVTGNYGEMGRRLADAGDIYRRPAYADGLLLASDVPNIEPEVITTGKRLAGIIADRVPVRVLKNGKLQGGMPSSAHLNTMLESEDCLRNFPPVDIVAKRAIYLPDWRLTVPGYNDGGLLCRVLHIGPPAVVSDSLDVINSFLDVMPFHTNADRTNAVGAALTVMLRHRWPGRKPLIALTATKSHSGKDTIIDFACGHTPHSSISHERADWAMQKNFIALVTQNPDIGVVNVENVRLNKNVESITSAFLERFLTDPRPVLYCTGTGDTRRRDNFWVVAMSTNFGSIGEDLMNRALPIHLDPHGDVADRESPIGNPRFEFLPSHRDEIEGGAAWHDCKVGCGRHAPL